MCTNACSCEILPSNCDSKTSSSKPSSTSENFDYGGLGIIYLRTTQQNQATINQMDTFTGVTETNGSVRSRSLLLARQLYNSGIGPKDIVMIISRSHAEQIIVIFATLLVGAIIAPLDLKFTYKDHLNMMTVLQPKICFCDLNALKMIQKVCRELNLNPDFVQFGQQQVRAIPFKIFLNKQNNVKFEPYFVDDPYKYPALILPTQGVTGFPKLVQHSHQFILTQSRELKNLIGDCKIIMSHYSLTWVEQFLIMTLSLDSPITRIVPEPFDNKNCCRIVRHLSADCIFLTPKSAIKLIGLSAINYLHRTSLKKIIIGGLRMTKRDVDFLIDALPKIQVIRSYCITEAGLIAYTTGEDYKKIYAESESVGKLLPGKGKIINIDTNEEVEPGKCGELVLKRDNLMLGYYKNESMAECFINNEYFRTGDYAMLTENGWLHIKCKVKELLDIGDYHFSPTIIEDVLNIHPYIENAAALFDNGLINACVILKPDKILSDNRLKEYLKERLEEYLMPFRYFFLDNFPKTTIGTIRRSLLKKLVHKIKYDEEYD